MRKEAKILLQKSLDSLVLSTEHFNRPWNTGREEIVLILLDRAFELLFKSIIVHKGGKIREPREKETIGFEKCVRKCVSDSNIKCLDEEQALTVQIINSLRDAAQHYILYISEQQLYMFSQAGITLYGQILKDVFKKKLHEILPERVLPISTKPPHNLASVISAEFEDIKRLATPGSRMQLQARAKLRSLAIIDSSLRGIRTQPSEGELGKLVRDIQSDKTWQTIFPGIATLRIDTTGSGLTVSIRLTKKEGEAVHLVPEGTPGATIVAVKRVSEIDFYTLGLMNLADHLGLSSSKLLAVINELEIQNNHEYFKIFKIGSVVHKRYSKKALDRLREALPTIDIDAIWTKRKAHAKKKG